MKTNDKTHGFFFKTFLHSLTLQASWTPQRMQNLGLIYAISPWLEQSDLTLKEKSIICRRHLNYFNTNPYYANFLIGGLLKLEDNASDNREGHAKLVRNYKESLGRALAALGDNCLWYGVRPAILLLSLLGGIYLSPYVALVPIFVFTIIQLTMRYFALKIGYNAGLGISEILSRPIWHNVIKKSKRTAAVLSGFGAGLFLISLYNIRDESDIFTGISIVAGIIAYYFLKRKLTVEGIILVLLPVISAIAYLQITVQ